MNDMNSAPRMDNGIDELSFEEIESVSGGFSESNIFGGQFGSPIYGGGFSIFPPGTYFDPNRGIFVYP